MGIVIQHSNENGFSNSGSWMGTVGRIIGYDKIPDNIVRKLRREDLLRTIVVVNEFEDNRKVGEIYKVLRDGTKIEDMFKWTSKEWTRFIRELILKHNGSGKYFVQDMLGRHKPTMLFKGWIE